MKIYDNEYFGTSFFCTTLATSKADPLSTRDCALPVLALIRLARGYNEVIRTQTHQLSMATIVTDPYSKAASMTLTILDQPAPVS
ncbi:MAG TPA: hypothetical protein VF534_13080 [Paraburkholderia sp.]